ncbi:hypothetical protein Fmac_020081 [Flemingia macrophylla]|uniref:Uncharacterized protein n=1 Tax=Flemingia macrophylla TaxID=520843 RepID=A0ABD1M9Q4_9FABA
MWKIFLKKLSAEFVFLNSEVSIPLMKCSCKGKLALVTRKYAVKWFSVKGDRICDASKQEVQNLYVTDADK